jgi:iron(III) transport system ATP-binding protein
MTDHPLAIQVRGVGKRFAETRALDEFSLDVPEGRLLALLGPSACGKTTALRAIAGFETPDTGLVEIRGRTVVGPGIWVPPEARRVGMVFQDYALFPHLTVARNVAYGLSKAADRRKRVAEVLELVGMAGLGERYPHELSGGQQQRTALARAMAPRPDVILLDEPFSNLDAALRDRVRREVRTILSESGSTAIFVTHDQSEALAVSDVVAVMRVGRVVQAASPDEVYRHPADPWIAGFLGDADFLVGHAAGGRVDTAVGAFPTTLSGPVTLMIRPESVTLVPDQHGDAFVSDREFFGHDQLVTVVLNGGTRLRSRFGPTPHLKQGQRVAVKVEDPVQYPG